MVIRHVAFDHREGSVALALQTTSIALITFPMAFERVEALRQWCNTNPNSL
jgi:hypothetical protein